MQMKSGDREDVLRRLPWVLGQRVEALEEAQQMLRECVRDLVLAGYSWADVGRMLGVSRQGARQRFGAEVDWWREHMGSRLPWEDWAAELETAPPLDEIEVRADYGRLKASGPVEDRR